MGARREFAMSGAAMSGSFWRAAGINYIKYLNATTGIVRNCLKEPAKSASNKSGGVDFMKNVWSGGKAGEPVHITQLLDLASKMWAGGAHRYDLGSSGAELSITQQFLVV